MKSPLTKLAAAAVMIIAALPWVLPFIRGTTSVYALEQTIVPGVRVGDYTLDMSKDDVLRWLGKPNNIHYGGEDYTLDHLPKRYFMFYHGISFHIVEDRVTGIATHSPRYTFANGLKVGDSEDKLKQAFGSDFKLEEFERMDALIYEEKGLRFEIDKKSRTIEEIGINQVKRDQRNMNIPKVHRRDELGPYEDVTGKDLRASDLRYSEDILDTLEFNQETQWPPPERLPEGFDPQVLLQEGMNPGLGVRVLHARGITGAGVHVGLIDQPLLLDHPEYAGKIVSYHSDCGSHKSSMHGPAMASQLVGKRCGTAPGARLHVVAVPSWEADAGYYARALDRFVAYNQNAPQKEKIRAVSVSCQPSGVGSVFKNQALWDEAVKRAQAQDILVLDCTWHHGFVSLCWLDPQNRESVEACTPGFRLGEVEVDEGHIHVPSAPRTAAEADEDRSFGYAYDGGGRRSRRPKAKNGYSDTIPYAAGILALGWQIRPELTPEQIKALLFESAHVHESGAKIIHPTAFIDLVRSQSNKGIVADNFSYDMVERTGADVRNGMLPVVSQTDARVESGEQDEKDTSDINEKIAQICSGPADFNDVIAIFGQPSEYVWRKQSFKLEDLPVKHYWIFYNDSIHILMHWDKVNRLEIVDSAYVFDGKIPMGSSLERVLSIVGQPKETVVGQRGWEDGVLYKDIDGRVGWCQYRREDLNADFRFLNYTLRCVSIFLENKSSSTPTGRTTKRGSSQTVKTTKSVNEFGDVRAKDLSKYDLSAQEGLIATLQFNQETVWPERAKMPPGSDPDKILTDAMNPGLGVRGLHRQGITGKGVNVAIIDQPLLKDHPEYDGKIVAYHDTGCGPSESSMHGPAVASLLVGTNCGTAPDARVYYAAAPSWKRDTAFEAKALDWIVEQNKKLPAGQRIRVVSVSAAPSSPNVRDKNQEMWDDACARAEADGMMVIDCTNSHRGFINRGWYTPGDPESVSKFNLGPPPQRIFRVDPKEMSLYVPSSCRTTAQHYDYHGRNSYIYWGRGGLSWSIPYCAGVLAMGWQIRPDLTPAQMKELLFASAHIHESGAKIIHPAAFIALVRKQSNNQHSQKHPQPSSHTFTIVPGVGVGGYTLGISKDDVLRQLGEPEAIQLGEDEVVRRGEEKYSLDNLPRQYVFSFGDISFWIEDDSVRAISVRSPLYKLSNGLKVGDSEQKIKQAFGEDFHLGEARGRTFLGNHAKGLGFEIHKKNRTATEIIVFQPEGDRGDRDVSKQQSGQVIVPGVGMGDFTLDMNKDDILRRLGKPDNIHFGGEDYTLDNLPQRYFMFYDGISFFFNEEGITGISTNSLHYQFANGLKVGDSQDRIIQAFGEDFRLMELERMDVLTYEAKGLRFEIDKRTKTIDEISVNQVERHQNDSDALDSGKTIKLSVQRPGPIMFPKIDRRPKPDKWRRGEMKSLPKYNPDSTDPFQVDLRSYDLSKLDLRNAIEDLMYADFDDGTVWPTADRMPEGFDRERIMELGKNPGLGVRKVHEQGITGRGIGIAIIDQPLLTEHQEYADRLRLYEEINVKPGSDPAMHGAAVASIALGKTVGVAPEADLYFIGSWTGDWGKGEDGFEWNFAYYAQAVRRILDINEQLPDDRKIRVISISVGWSSKQKGYDEMTAAVEEAKKAGMLVVCSCIDDVHGFVFDGLSRAPLSDPDDFASCEPGLWLAKGFYRGRRKWNQLWVPMGSRTTAAPNGLDEYVFYRMGGWSWAIPYVAGVYGLAAQVDPEITPDRFWKLAMNTGRTVEVEHQGAKYELGPITDPVRLIRAIQADETATLNRRQSDTQPTKTHRQTDSETLTIVPGVGVGDYSFGMSKDDVLSKLGEPDVIHLGPGEDEVVRRGEENYNLDGLPNQCALSFGDVTFLIDDDSVGGIFVHSPLYKLSNGLKVGDSEQKIKQTFGEDFRLEEAFGKDYLCYDAKGLAFVFHKKNRTVTEIVVFQMEGGGGDPDVPDSAEAALVRKAAAEGRIAYKLTTPDEFKAIAGQPTKEWTESDDEIIYLKYPGMHVEFFGKPKAEIPHTLVSLLCEGRRIDIGQNRQVVLRHEGDLDKLGSFSGLSDVDLSWLDLSEKGDILKTTSFDSLTVWPPSDRLPPGFDPVKLLAWGKNPGLGVRSLHREGITGKGVGIAIIDQPLLKNHIEYADRIKSYHAIEVEGVDIQMHGPPVCSIAVGKNCGVAPEASLHYYAVPPWKWGENRPWARTVEQIVERNRDLPPSEKVRVISISLGAFWQRDYLEVWQSAVEKAHRNGILVVTCDPLFLRYVTLERLVGKDPDDPNNYTFDSGVNALYVPASNWSIASHRGKDVYTFDTRGGNSWTVPYLAGLAAMAFQVHPEISPERIVTLFQETATRTKQGRVINPRGFIEAVKGL